MRDAAGCLVTFLGRVSGPVLALGVEVDGGEVDPVHGADLRRRERRAGLQVQVETGAADRADSSRRSSPVADCLRGLRSRAWRR